MKFRFRLLLVIVFIGLYLCLPTQISDRNIYYVKDEKVFTGQLAATRISSFFNKFQPGTGLIELFQWQAPFINTKEVLALEDGDNMNWGCVDKENNRLFAIISNSKNNTYNIVEYVSGQKNIIKNIDKNEYYYNLQYYNNKLYYYQKNTENEDKCGVTSLDLSTGVSKIELKNYNDEFVVCNNLLIFQKEDGDKTKNIYCLDNDGEIKILVENASSLAKLDDNTILFLRNDRKNICSYNLKTNEIKTVGLNDSRRWMSPVIIVDNDYYITKKLVVSYDVLSKYTVNDFKGGMLVLPYVDTIF